MVGYRRRAAAALIAAALALTSAVAWPEEAAVWKQRAEGNRAGAELDWWSTGRSSSLSWAVTAQLEVIEHLHFTLDIPFTYLDWEIDGGSGGSGGENSQFAFGNPTLGLHWAKVLDKMLGYFYGGFVSAPTQVGESPIGADEIAFDATAHTARRFAIQSRAFLNYNRFFSEYAFAGAHGGVELRLGPGLYSRMDITMIIAIPVSRTAPGSGFMLQALGELEGRADFGLGAGGRFQAALYEYEPIDDDIVQTALEPYVVYWPDRGFYARVGFLVALDNVLGPGFDKDKVRTVTTALGGSW